MLPRPGVGLYVPRSPRPAHPRSPAPDHAAHAHSFVQAEIATQAEDFALNVLMNGFLLS